jgi:hypothetical protein
MTARADLTGKRFGHLKVLRFSHVNERRQGSWTCRCDCGAECNAISGDLNGGNRQSCGCSFEKHGMARTVEYQSYAKAKYRCTNPDDLRWADYGGRGIKFKFKSFEEFFAELGLRPAGKSLDRFPNNDGHYEVGNVRWATAREQISNRRPCNAKKVA